MNNKDCNYRQTLEDTGLPWHINKWKVIINITRTNRAVLKVEMMSAQRPRDRSLKTTLGGCNFLECFYSWFKNLFILLHYILVSLTKSPTLQIMILLTSTRLFVHNHLQYFCRQPLTKTNWESWGWGVGGLKRPRGILHIRALVLMHGFETNLSDQWSEVVDLYVSCI